MDEHGLRRRRVEAVRGASKGYARRETSAKTSEYRLYPSANHRALDRERFEEIHATYLLLKEKKSTEADINGISGGGNTADANNKSGGGQAADPSAQYPRSLSAQVTTSKNNRRSSHDQQQSVGAAAAGVQPTQPPSNVAQQPIPEGGGKPTSMFYVPNLGSGGGGSSKSGASRNSAQPSSTAAAPNSPASVAFRQVPFNNRQPALSVQPATGAQAFVHPVQAGNVRNISSPEELRAPILERVQRRVVFHSPIWA